MLIVRLLIVLTLFASSLTGCISNSAARAQARSAYLAGQRDAVAHMSRQQPETEPNSAVLNTPSNVTFMGPVEHPVVPWSEDLTLAKAILSAVYHSPIDPVMIVIKRSNEEIQVQPARLLSGGDFPLKPGDIIEIQLPPQ